MSVSADHRIQRLAVDGLRTSDPATLSVLVPEALRLHIERIEPGCVADLFALSELALPGSLGVELGTWAARATREIRDLPDGSSRRTFVAEIGELNAGAVPRRLRDAILALEAMSSVDLAGDIRALGRAWAETAPEAVVLPIPKPTRGEKGGSAKAAKDPAAKAATPKAPARARPVRTPAALVDPRRAEWIREDAVTRLNSREYQERGLKETIFLAGIKHRSPYKDLTDEEIKSELRKLERERKLKHTGERWLIR